MKRSDVFYVPNSLSIQRVKAQEGPKIQFVVWSGRSSRTFADKESALKFIRWPKNTPTGALIREWFEQFENSGELIEPEASKINQPDSVR